MSVNKQRKPIVLYPNLVEEICIREGRARHIIFSRILEAANITEELFAAALVDGEKLTGYELHCVAQTLDRPTDYIKCGVRKTFDINNDDKETFLIFGKKLDRLTVLKSYMRGWTESNYQIALSFHNAALASGIMSLAHYLYAADSLRRADNSIGSDLSKVYASQQPPPRDIKKRTPKKAAAVTCAAAL
jgi:hypothetical protein